MASSRCYDNFDVIATLIMTNFRLIFFFHFYLCNTTVVAMFPNVCFWRRSLCLNLAGIDPEKLYQATFHMPVRPMLLHRMALVSFRPFCKKLGNLQEFFGQMVYCPPRPTPPAKHCPYVYAQNAP